MSPPVVDRRSRLDPDAVAAVLALADRAVAQDGVDPLNEVARDLLVAPGDTEVLHLGVDDDHGLVGHLMAYRHEQTWQAECVVEPHHRRQGIGVALVATFLGAVPAGSVAQVWAHGDLPGAAPLAGRAGLRAVRTLLRLTRTDAAPVPAPEVPDGLHVRAFRPGADDQSLIAVNARAFAHHPEQGAMDAADLARRTGSDWFDPAGLLLVEDDGGRLLGFHWTKVTDGVGEIYVMAVAPDAQGRGLGGLVAATGLHHLTTERGLERVDLYAEGDNERALAVYHRQGFVEAARDVLYRH